MERSVGVACKYQTTPESGQSKPLLAVSEQVWFMMLACSVLERALPISGGKNFFLLFFSRSSLCGLRSSHASY